MRNRWLAIGLLLVTASAHAQNDESKHAMIKELFVVMHMQDRMELMKATAMQSAQELAKQQVSTLALPKSQSDVAAGYYQKINALVVETCDWQKLEPLYERVYANVYTENEIDGVLTFYKSPSGQAWLVKAPEVTGRLADISKEQLNSIEPQIRQLTKELIAQLEATQPHQ